MMSSCESEDKTFVTAAQVRRPTTDDLEVEIGLDQAAEAAPNFHTSVVSPGNVPSAHWKSRGWASATATGGFRACG